MLLDQNMKKMMFGGRPFVNTVLYGIVILIFSICKAEESQRCFMIPVTKDKQDCTINGCTHSNKYHFDSMPNKLQIKLTCPPDSTLEIQDVTYSMPATQDNYCPPTCDKSDFCHCPCRKNVKEQKYCNFKMSKEDQDNLSPYCKNVSTEGCFVNVSKITFNKASCPELDFECEQTHNGERINFCVSRWVDVEYECIGKLRTIWYIIIGVCCGFVLLIIIIVIIRKLVYDRNSEAYDTNDNIREGMKYSSVKNSRTDYGEVKKLNKDSIKHNVPSIAYEDEGDDDDNSSKSSFSKRY